jgi:hypothetical protein
VRVVAAATEDDMVAAFLRAKVGSPRFGPKLLAALAHQGLDRSVLQQPDTGDAVANAARCHILAAYRGYPDREVFTDLPADTVWQWVTLTPKELLGVRYIDWDYWLEVTGGTRRPVDAIPRIGHSPNCRELAAEITAGRLPPELIIVGRPGGQDLVVLEGHVRLTTLVMAVQYLPAELTVLLGTSPTMRKEASNAQHGAGSSAARRWPVRRPSLDDHP